MRPLLESFLHGLKLAVIPGFTEVPELCSDCSGKMVNQFVV
jgi:hypothetical protein